MELEMERMQQEKAVSLMQFKIEHLRFMIRRPKRRAHDLLLLAQVYRLVPGDALYSTSIPSSTAAGALVMSHERLNQ